MGRLSALLAWTAVLAAIACSEADPQRVPTPPTIAILEPDPAGEMYETVQGEAVEFVATVTDGYDPSDELVVVWTTEWEDDDGHWFEGQLGTSGVDPQGRSSFITAALESGVHTVTATVTDTDDLSDSDYVSVRVLASDEPPQVEITTPLDGAEVEEGAAVHFSAVADDDHDPSLLDVSWTSDLDGLLDGTAPSALGAMAFETDALSPGAHEIELAVTDEGGSVATDSVTLVVLAENEPPTTPTVTIEPPGPQTEDDLLCIASASVDPEGATVTYTYAWDLDGQASGWTGDSLSYTETVNRDEWTCWATPEDDLGLQGVAGSAVVVIGNTLPATPARRSGPRRPTRRASWPANRRAGTIPTATRKVRCTSGGWTARSPAR